MSGACGSECGGGGGGACGDVVCLIDVVVHKTNWSLRTRSSAVAVSSNVRLADVCATVVR